MYLRPLTSYPALNVKYKNNVKLAVYTEVSTLAISK